MQCLASSFTYDHKRALLCILTKKMRSAIVEEDNFLLYVRNPCKICILVVELVVKDLEMLERGSPFKHEANVLVEDLKALALKLLIIQRN